METKARLFISSGLGRPGALLQALKKIGLPVPADVRANDAPERLSASGFSYSATEVDAALSKFDCDPVQRIALKRALEHFGLLDSSASRLSASAPTKTTPILFGNV